MSAVKIEIPRRGRRRELQQRIADAHLAFLIEAKALGMTYGKAVGFCMSCESDAVKAFYRLRKGGNA